MLPLKENFYCQHYLPLLHHWVARIVLKCFNLASRNLIPGLSPFRSPLCLNIGIGLSPEVHLDVPEVTQEAKARLWLEGGRRRCQYEQDLVATPPSPSSTWGWGAEDEEGRLTRTRTRARGRRAMRSRPIAVPLSCRYWGLQKARPRLILVFPPTRHRLL